LLKRASEQEAIEKHRYDTSLALWDVWILPFMNQHETEQKEFPNFEKKLKHISSQVDSKAKRDRKELQKNIKKNKIEAVIYEVTITNLRTQELNNFYFE
jgi:hypothetical protein